MTDTSWHPRGTPTWPDWKKAKSGTRVEHVLTGATGTFLKASKNPNNGAVIRWDARTTKGGLRLGGRDAYVIAPAFDLRPLD